MSDDESTRDADDRRARRETYLDPSASDAGTEQLPAHRADIGSDDLGESHEPVVIEHPVGAAPISDGPAPFEDETSPGSRVDDPSDDSPTPAPAPASAPGHGDSQLMTPEPLPAPVPASASTPTASPSNAPATGTPSSPTEVLPAEHQRTPVQAQPAERRPEYVEPPQQPSKRGNRGFGAIIAALSTLVFGIVWAAVAAVVIALNTQAAEFLDSFSNFALSAAFWTPVGIFFIAFLLLALLLNRAGWGWYIAFGFIVGVLVYGGYLMGALLTVSQQITPAEVAPFLRSIALTPLAIGAGLVAREVSIWGGAAISARGRRVKARNLEAQNDYESKTAEWKADYERVRSERSS